MITLACRRPGRNKDMIINTGIPHLQFNTAGGPQDRFGINLSTRQLEMTRIDFRLLPCPSLLFGSKTESNLAGGAWTLRERRFALPATSDAVRISYIEVRRPNGTAAPNITQFARGIQEGIRRYLNLTVNFQRFPDFQHVKNFSINTDADQVAKELSADFRNLKERNIKLVFVLLPDKSSDTYYAVKKAGDALAGIHTVCAARDDKGLLKVDPGTLANILLKVNAKLGGRNWSLSMKAPTPYSRLLKSGTMVIGADVVHPTAAAMLDAPSIAAVVSTYDEQFCEYSGSTRLQQNLDENKKSVEVILDLRGLMIQRLKFYQSKNNGKLPDLLIYMRDGVSEGQFVGAILEHELPSIKRACVALYENVPMPKIVIITTLKRHNTRFYQDTGDKSTFWDKNGNPMPGFTVDKDIVSKYAADFYNVSHACIQGTSKPCKYVLLYDTLGVTADEIQMMVYHQCFTFARATRSIGEHPAVRYAHLLCQRAKLYFRSVYSPALILGADKPRYSVTAGHWPGEITNEIRNTMFFI